MNPAPDLSVVIPVYNRGVLVRHTLESVRAASAEIGRAHV
jgi:glycosyltransferase involved in cell wall biosynthesis